MTKKYARPCFESTSSNLETSTGYYLTMDANNYYCPNLEPVYRKTTNALIDDVVVKAYKDEVEQERHKKLYKDAFDI